MKICPRSWGDFQEITYTDSADNAVVRIVHRPTQLDYAERGTSLIRCRRAAYRGLLRRVALYTYGLRLRREYDDLRRQAMLLDRRARAAKERLDERCPHADTEYYPDASGNNDSTTWCNHCERDLPTGQKYPYSS